MDTYRIQLAKNVLLIAIVATVFFGVITLSVDLAKLNTRNEDKWTSSDRNMVITSFILGIIIDGFGFYCVLRDRFFGVLFYGLTLFLLWLIGIIVVTKSISGHAINVIDSILTLTNVILAFVLAWFIRQRNLMLGPNPPI